MSGDQVSPGMLLDLHSQLLKPIGPERRTELEAALLQLQKRPGYLVSGLRLCSPAIAGPAAAASIPSEMVVGIQQFTATQIRRVLLNTWTNTPESVEKERQRRLNPQNFQHEVLRGPEGINLLSSDDDDDEDDYIKETDIMVSELQSGCIDPNFREVIISDGEKKAFREGIFSVFIASPPCLHNLLIDIIKTIAHNDYPSHWPTILGEVGRTLKTSQDLETIKMTLHTLLMLFKPFEYFQLDDPRRQPLYQLVEACFPTVLALGQKMLTVNTDTARSIQKFVVRLFYSATNMSIPPFFLKKWDNLVPWMDFMFRLLALPQPPGEPQGDSREDWGPWKMRKWIFHTFIRILTRYGNFRKGFPEEWRPWCTRLFKTFSPKMLQVTMNYLNFIRKRQYLPRRLTQTLLGFIDSAYRYKALYAIMKPHLPALLGEVMLPIISFGPRDMLQWRDNPQEFIRSQSDVMQDFFDPRKTAVAVLQSLVQDKKKDLLRPFADFLVGCFKEFAQNPSPSLPQAGKFFGALTCFGLIHDSLVRNRALSANLEPIIKNVLVPAMGSKFPFVRARAIWTFALYSDIQFKDQTILSTGLSRILHLMTDSELPVKVEAIMGIRCFAEFDVCRDVLHKHLPRLIQIIFSLFQDFDHDELVECLEVLILRFGEEIQPFAEAMCKKFATQFHRLMKTVEETDNDVLAIAVDEILRAVIALLAAVRKCPDLYQRMEAPLLSMVKRVLKQDCIDYVEHGFKILSFLTYFPGSVTPNLWKFYVPCLQIFNSWGSDFVAEIVPLLDNYIANGTDTFVDPNNPYLDLTMRMIEKCFRGRGEFSGRDPECGEAAKLAEVILQTCRGRIDKYIPGLMNMTFLRLKTCKNRGVVVLLITLLGNIFFYNPLLAIQVCEKKKITATVLRGWFKHGEGLKKLYDQKLMVLGMSTVLLIPFEKAPADIQKAAPHFVQLCIKVLEKMANKIAEKERKKEEKKAMGQRTASQSLLDQSGRKSRAADGGFDDSDEEDSGSEDDVIDGDSRQGVEDLTLAQISDLREEAKHRIATGDYDTEDSSSGDEYEELEEEEDDGTNNNIVDNTDELVYFVDSLGKFKNRYPAVYQKIHSGLVPEAKRLLTEMIPEAEKRRKQSSQ